MKATKAFLLGILSTLLVVSIVGFAHPSLEITWHKVQLEYNGKPFSGSTADPFLYENQGKQVPLAFLYEGTTYVPLRLIAEQFNKEVTWDEGSRTVAIRDRQVDPADEGQDHVVDDGSRGGEKVEFTLVTEPSQELQTWVKGRTGTEGQYVKTEKEKTYILITRGEKNTGGYGVGVEAVYLKDGKLNVDFGYIDPSPDDMVIEVFTYPYVLIQVEGEWMIDQLQFNLTTPVSELTPGSTPPSAPVPTPTEPKAPLNPSQAK